MILGLQLHTPLELQEIPFDPCVLQPQAEIKKNIFFLSVCILLMKIKKYLHFRLHIVLLHENLSWSHYNPNEIWQIKNFQCLKCQSCPNFQYNVSRVLIVHLVHHKFLGNQNQIQSIKQNM